MQNKAMGVISKKHAAFTRTNILCFTKPLTKTQFFQHRKSSELEWL